ncbi:MAG: aspartate aminotransferase family protein [Melioribacteraceae bacterium]|nr:aspartate aminotransferase family protein [Melioribacteraceae bacterium]
MTQTKLQTSSLLKNYSRYPIEFTHGKGALLFDKNGNEYLDFLSGIAVTSFGHCHPKIVDAVKEQTENLWHVSNLFESSGQEKLAASLTDKTGLDKVFFCNSGTEANEAAIKFARKWDGERSTIITAINSFHGRTMGSLAASGQYKLWQGFAPLCPGFKYVPYNDTEAIEYSITKDVVAIMVEPIQGEGGIMVPSEDYFARLRNICDKQNLLLIIDEVQAGIGRTGKYFAYQWSEIKPDIITSAKGIANGLPLGAVICNDKVAEKITPGSHGSTFGGNPIAVAAANKVMDLLDEDCIKKIEMNGILIKEKIKALNSSIIKEVRGKGLMLGIEFKDGFSAKTIASKLLDNKIIVGTSGEQVLRLLPPFIIDEQQIKLFINKFREIVKLHEFISATNSYLEENKN